VEPERTAPQEEVPGFLRNDKTFSFHVIRKIVRGATIDRVTGGDPALIPAFIESTRALEAGEAKAIVGDCGLISSYQEDIAKSVSVPVASSSSLLIPLAYHMLGKSKKVGIITAESKKLSERHFLAEVEVAMMFQS